MPGSPDSPVSAGRPAALEKGVMAVETSTQDSQPLLVPRPSDDPRDPLNWRLFRKMLVTSALLLALFTGMCAPVNGQIQIAQQAKLYGKTTVEITYFVSNLEFPINFDIHSFLTLTMSELSSVRRFVVGLLVLVAFV